MDTKTISIYMLFTIDILQAKDMYILKVKDLEKRFHMNVNQKKAGVAILISDKTDFKIKDITSDKKGYYIITNRSIQEEDIIVINIYSLNIGAQYIRQMLTTTKGEINSNTVTAGDFNTITQTKDRSSKQKINNETQALNDTLDHMDLTYTGYSIQKQ